MERSRFEVSAEFLLLSFTRVREAYALTRGDPDGGGKRLASRLLSFFLSLRLSLSSFFSCRQSDRDRPSFHALFFDDRAYSRKVGIRLFRESGKTQPKNVSKGREGRGRRFFRDQDRENLLSVEITRVHVPIELLFRERERKEEKDNRKRQRVFLCWLEIKRWTKEVVR